MDPVTFRESRRRGIPQKSASLKTLVEIYGDQQPVEVFEVVMDGLADKRGAIVWPGRWQHVTAPPKRAKTRTGGTDTEDTAEMAGAEGWSSSPCPSVGTDAETDDDDVIDKTSGSGDEGGHQVDVVVAVCGPFQGVL